MFSSPAAAAAPDSPLVGAPEFVLRVLSISTLSLGIMFLITSRSGGRELKTNLLLSVPMRFLTSWLFWKHGAKGVALYEMSMGVLNGILLGAWGW